VRFGGSEARTLEEEEAKSEQWDDVGLEGFLPVMGYRLFYTEGPKCRAGQEKKAEPHR
jgi:hypothetical protein